MTVSNEHSFEHNHDDDGNDDNDENNESKNFAPLAVIVSHKLLWGGKLLRLFQPHILQRT